MFQGNHYKLWIISLQNEVCYINAQGEAIAVSEEGFASNIAISEEGVIWAMTTLPDPDGGGVKIAWLDRNLTWHIINTIDPGAFGITGGREDECIYRTSSGVVIKMDTQGNGETIYDSDPVHSLDYGGSMLWGSFTDRTGAITRLQYADYSDSLRWNEFMEIQSPTSLCVNYRGDCVGIENFNPFVYQLPETSRIFGSGAKIKAMQISFKHNPYLLGAAPTIHGNPIYEWTDAEGGTWVDTGVKGNRVLSTYYNGVLS